MQKLKKYSRARRIKKLREKRLDKNQNMKLVELRNISKSYDDKVVLDSISFKMDAGESVAVVGPSGAGKSTVLKILSSLENADSGEVHLGDDNVAMAFQYSALFDFLSVFENIAFALKEREEFKKMFSEADIKFAVTETLKTVGLSGIEEKFPSELSGGMQKRVSFARAIITNPKIILYDEPTAGLDPISSTIIEDYINCLKNKLQAASIIVTHNLSTIKRTADRVIMLYGGKIVWQGTNEDFFSTENEYVQQFVHAKAEGPIKAYV